MQDQVEIQIIYCFLCILPVHPATQEQIQFQLYCTLSIFQIVYIQPHKNKFKFNIFTASSACFLYIQQHKNKLKLSIFTAPSAYFLYIQNKFKFSFFIAPSAYFLYIQAHKNKFKFSFFIDPQHTSCTFRTSSNSASLLPPQHTACTSNLTRTSSNSASLLPPQQAHCTSPANLGRPTRTNTNPLNISESSGQVTVHLLVSHEISRLTDGALLSKWKQILSYQLFLPLG